MAVTLALITVFIVRPVREKGKLLINMRLSVCLPRCRMQDKALYA